LLDGYVPTMQDGDVMGHECMGEVVEVGPGVDSHRAAAGSAHNGTQCACLLYPSVGL